jgi:hypothetical protein
MSLEAQKCFLGSEAVGRLPNPEWWPYQNPSTVINVSLNVIHELEEQLNPAIKPRIRGTQIPRSVGNTTWRPSPHPQCLMRDKA